MLNSIAMHPKENEKKKKLGFIEIRHFIEFTSTKILDFFVNYVYDSRNSYNFQLSLCTFT